jgi:hypothetical protein
MGRFYPIESALFLLKGKPRLAFRRLCRPAQGLVEGIAFDVYYHTVRSMRGALGPRFELKEVKGIRAMVRIPKSLQFLDRWWSSSKLFGRYSDHFVSVWQYRAT